MQNKIFKKMKIKKIKKFKKSLDNNLINKIFRNKEENRYRKNLLILLIEKKKAKK